MSFIGRAEKLTERILSRLFLKSEILRQVPISKLITSEDFAEYGEEFANHTCDLVFNVMNSRCEQQTLVIEVNYQHKEKAAGKWRRTFEPDIKRAGNFPVTFDNWDCRSSIPKTKGLFYLNSKNEHGPITWNDFRDVQDQLEKAGVFP